MEFIYTFFFSTGNVVFTLVLSNLLAHVLIIQQKVIILSVTPRIKAGVSEYPKKFLILCLGLV